MAGGLHRGTKSGRTRGPRGGGTGSPMHRSERVFDLRGVRVDQRSVYPDQPPPAPVGTRCWLCGQVPRMAGHLEPFEDAWRCKARRACAQRGPDPLREGQA